MPRNDVDFLAVRDPLDWSLPLVWHCSLEGEHADDLRRLALYDIACTEDRPVAVRPRGRLAHRHRPHVHAGTIVYLPRSESGRRSSIATPAHCRGRAWSASRSTPTTSRRRPKRSIAWVTSSATRSSSRTPTARCRPMHGLGNGPDRRRSPGRGRGRNRCGDARVSRSVRHVRPGLVGDRRRPAGRDPARLCRVPRRLSARGSHTVVFTYRPAGFELGLALTGCGVVLGLVLWFLPRLSLGLAPEHAVLGWPSWWRTWWFAALGAIVLVSSVTIGPGWRIALHDRWRDSVHTHTWGCGVAAQKGYRM